LEQFEWQTGMLQKCFKYLHVQYKLVKAITKTCSLDATEGPWAADLEPDNNT